MIAIMSMLIEALSPLLREMPPMAVGATLFARGDAVQHLHVVRKGGVHLVRTDADGNPAVMQRATAGQLLAESSVFSPVYHCDAVVVADAVLARADMAAVRRRLEHDAGLMGQLARHLAEEVQRGRVRAEILSLKTVRERLDAWLAFNDGGLPPAGSWRSIAEDIGVSPEAFYRELKRRRDMR